LCLAGARPDRMLLVDAGHRRDPRERGAVRPHHVDVRGGVVPAADDDPAVPGVAVAATVGTGTTAKNVSSVRSKAVRFMWSPSMIVRVSLRSSLARIDREVQSDRTPTT
jgi:hypothetical protein